MNYFPEVPSWIAVTFQELMYEQSDIHRLCKITYDYLSELYFDYLYNY